MVQKESWQSEKQFAYLFLGSNAKFGSLKNFGGGLKINREMFRGLNIFLSRCLFQAWDKFPKLLFCHLRWSAIYELDHDVRDRVRLWKDKLEHYLKYPSHEWRNEKLGICMVLNFWSNLKYTHGRRYFTATSRLSNPMIMLLYYSISRSSRRVMTIFSWKFSM